MNDCPSTKKRPLEKDEAPSSPWQAFKRLKVQEESSLGNGHNDHDHNDDDMMIMSTTPPQRKSTVPQQERQQTPGQDSREETESSGFATTRRSLWGPLDTNQVDSQYPQVNSLLGDLHKERLLRHQHQESQQQHHSESSAISTRKSSERHSSFQTPPHRRRKVVHLHTNSKLG